MGLNLSSARALCGALAIFTAASSAQARIMHLELSGTFEIQNSSSYITNFSQEPFFGKLNNYRITYTYDTNSIITTIVNPPAPGVVGYELFTPKILNIFETFGNSSGSLPVTNGFYVGEKIIDGPGYQPIFSVDYINDDNVFDPYIQEFARAARIGFNEYLMSTCHCTSGSNLDGGWYIDYGLKHRIADQLYWAGEGGLELDRNFDIRILGDNQIHSHYYVTYAEPSWFGMGDGWVDSVTYMSTSIDNIELFSDVPEPEAWLEILLGFSIAGLWLRRTRLTSSAATKPTPSGSARRLARQALNSGR